MRIAMAHGEIRFAPTPPVEGSNVVGVVGYVPEDGDPIPMLPVRSMSAADHGYAIASVMGEADDRMANIATRLAARTVDVAAEADAILAWMRKDFERRGSRSDAFPLLHDRDEGEVRELVRLTLSTSLKADAFRTCQEFCPTVQVAGDMELVGIVAPACERARTAADAPSVAIEAANILRTGFDRNPAWATHGPSWIEAVSTGGLAPVP